MFHFLCSCSYLFTFLLSFHFCWHIRLESTAYFFDPPCISLQWTVIATCSVYFTAWLFMVSFGHLCYLLLEWDLKLINVQLVVCFTGFALSPVHKMASLNGGLWKKREVRCLLSSCVRLSVRHRPVLYRNDWANRAGFWHGGFLSQTVLTYNEIWVFPKIRVLPYKTLFQTTTVKISPRQVDRVVNKTRRRRSSLLMTPIRQSTSRGFLLQVGQL